MIEPATEERARQPSPRRPGPRATGRARSSRAARVAADAPLDQRVEILWDIAGRIDRERDEIAGARGPQRRQAAPRGARRDRAGRTQLPLLRRRRRQALRSRRCPPQERCTTRLRQPIGVVGAIVPWNFPLVIASLEDRAGARLRQRGAGEAGGADPAHRTAAGRDLRGRRRPRRHACRCSSAAARPSGGRCSITPPVARSRSPARPRSAARSWSRGGRALQALDARARRASRPTWSSPTPTSTVAAEEAVSLGVRQRRPGLLRADPGPRRAPRLRRVRRRASTSGSRPSSSATRSPRRPRWDPLISAAQRDRVARLPRGCGRPTAPAVACGGGGRAARAATS